QQLFLTIRVVNLQGEDFRTAGLGANNLAIELRADVIDGDRHLGAGRGGKLTGLLVEHHKGVREYHLKTTVFKIGTLQSAYRLHHDDTVLVSARTRFSTTGTGLRRQRQLSNLAIIDIQLDS